MYSNVAPTTMTTMAAPVTYSAPTTYTSAPVTTMTTMAAPVTTVGGASTSVMAAPTMTYSGSQTNLVGGSVTTSMAQPTTTYATQTLAPSGSVTSLSGAALSGSMQAPIMSYTQSPQTVTRMASFGNQSPAVSRMSSLGAPLTGQQHSSMPYMPMGGAVDPSTAFTAGANLTFASGAPKPVQMPKRPRNHLEGVPNLQDIAKQESAYQAALNKQLEVAIKTIKEEIEIEKQMIRFNTEKNIALFTMQEEEKQAEAFALLDEKLAIQSLELKKALVERNLQLSAQANGLRMDYQQKFLEDELAMKQYEFGMQYYKDEHKLEEDYAAQVAIANTGTAYAAPAGVTGPANFSGGVAALAPMKY